MSKKPLTRLEITNIIITTIFLMYGSFIMIFNYDSKSGKVLIFMSLISFSFMFFKTKIKF